MARKLKFEEYEGAMAKAQLQKIEMYAAKLNEMIHPDDELEGWVQNKLSVVAAYMGDVKHYLDYALKNEFGDGGIAPQKPRHWEVEFTWEEADEESRKVNVMADSVSEAEEQVRMKFGPYYKGLKVVEVEEDKEITWEEYAKRPKKYEIESTTDYETIEGEDEDDAKEKWMKRRSGDSIKSEIVSVKRKFAHGGDIKEGDILETKTGVKVKVVDYDPAFGGRVRVLRMDEFGDGKPSQFMTLNKFKKMADGGMMAKLEGSTMEEDMQDAEDYLGREQWKSLTEEDKINATQYLKAKGKIGYFGQEEELMDVLSAEAYRSGGSIYRGMRPSPSVSATAYPEGHRMMGNDGNFWQIAINSAGTHRWVRVQGERPNYSLERQKVRQAIEILESMRGDIDVDDEIAALKKTLQ